MKNILTAPWMVEMIRTVTNMYDHGWDERNGGNVSLLLEESQVNDYVDGAVLREIPTGFSCPELDGKYFLVTGTGKYFKNVQYAPEINLGLVRLTDGERHHQGQQRQGGDGGHGDHGRGDAGPRLHTPRQSGTPARRDTLGARCPTLPIAAGSSRSCSARPPRAPGRCTTPSGR